MVFKLHYFPARGAGEPIRQLFKLAEEEFEDIRYSDEEWEKHRSEMPFGKMPVLEFDGTKIAQSAAIGRFVARKFGFGGKTPVEQAHVDSIVDQWKDFYASIQEYIHAELETESEKHKNAPALFDNQYAPARDRFFGFLTTILKKNGSGWLVGDSVTWADLLIADRVRSLQIIKAGSLDGFPEILALQKKVDSIPQIKEWIAVRPPTEEDL